ncbi:MAG: OpgC domain-containing protein [Verrucomicrobiota bacterium JB022]|nr:OpgC domain-containing protein [Verrucomicrobiota bacterium JB022]
MAPATTPQLAPQTVTATKSPPAPTKPGRDIRLDVLRGLFLVLMTVNHIPNPWHDRVVQPVGFLSVAEGFVFMAAYLCGVIFTKRIAEKGYAFARRFASKRALTIYGCHAVLLLIGFFAAWQIGPSPQPTAWIFDRVLHDPLGAIFTGLTLLYQPSFFDILPMYILGVWATPWVLRHTQEHGWWKLAAVSGLVWLAAQFGLKDVLQSALAAHLPVYMGAFDIFAWQALWLGGLFLGQQQWLARERTGQALRVPRRWALVSLVAVVGFMALRHALPHLEPMWSHAIYPVMDKWHLAPGRVLNLAAMVVFVMSFSPPRLPALPPFRFLNVIGRQSLPVFTAHVPLAVIGVTWVHVYQPSMWSITGYYLACLTLLWAVARFYELRKNPVRKRPRTDVVSSVASTAPDVPPHAVPPR